MKSLITSITIIGTVTWLAYQNRLDSSATAICVTFIFIAVLVFMGCETTPSVAKTEEQEQEKTE